MSASDPTSFLLMRHGETDWNRSRRVQGHDDRSRLTLEGRKHVADVARTLVDPPPTRIVASDLHRASESATIAGEILGLEVTHCALLRERNFGTFEGQARATLTAELTGIADGVIVDPRSRPPRGESLQQFVERAGTALDYLHDRWPDEYLLVVCHGGTMNALRLAFYGHPLTGQPFDVVANCAVWSLPRQRLAAPAEE